MTSLLDTISRPALRLLQSLSAGRRPVTPAISADADALVRADLAAYDRNAIVITQTGASYLARHAGGDLHIDAFRKQHLSIADAPYGSPDTGRGAKFDEAESPLMWLARRKGKDGRALLAPHLLQAGERLRGEFTLAEMMPRTTSNWHSPVAGRGNGGQGSHHSDRVIAARQRVRRALDAAGPEFCGLLLDVCCFLKGLDVVERERGWPTRSAKVVLQLALERLARHYGYQSETTGKSGAAVRTWLAADAAFDVPAES